MEKAGKGIPREAGELTFLSNCISPEALAGAMRLAHGELHHIAVHHFRRERLRAHLAANPKYTTWK